jgi:hypothetical protein
VGKDGGTVFLVARGGPETDRLVIQKQARGSEADNGLPSTTILSSGPTVKAGDPASFR